VFQFELGYFTLNKMTKIWTRGKTNCIYSLLKNEKNILILILPLQNAPGDFPA
jgi:hypothetical protein